MVSPVPRPPLPDLLSHDGVRFILDRSIDAGTLTPELVAAIAAALHHTLPEGDLFVDANGELHTRSTAPGQHCMSLWYQAGLLAGIERSSL
jgi:hypothetical protein